MRDKMIIWSIIFALLLVGLFLLQIPQSVWDLYRTYRTMRSIPSIPGHWLWGNLDMIQQDPPSRLKFFSYLRDNRKHKVVKIRIDPFTPIVWISHQEPLRKFIKFDKPKEVYSFLIPWLGDGLLCSTGLKNKRNRRMITPAFHHDILKGYVPVMHDCLELFLNKWKISAEKGKAVDSLEDIAQLTLDIMSRCAFSTESNCQQSNENPFIKAIPYIVDEVYDRMVRGIIYGFDFIYFLSSYGKKFKNTCEIAHRYTEAIIEKRKKALKLDENGVLNEESEAILKRALESRKNLDFLDMLLTARDEDGKGLTDLEIRDEVDTFLYAGFDTTSNALTSTLYCLAKHPEHQEKIREEVRNVLMGKKCLEHEDLSELKFTSWCLKEAMRLYPSVVVFSRMTEEDVEVDGHTIPKGVIVVFDIVHIHRHLEIWENPDEYDPLRFSPSNTLGRDPYAFIPFSVGHRSCPGQTFAMNEGRIILASIISKFEVTIDESYREKIPGSIVLPPIKDLKLKLKAIEA